jgi:hypothetical protein
MKTLLLQAAPPFSTMSDTASSRSPANADQAAQPPQGELEALNAELARTRSALFETERQLSELRDRRSKEMARLQQQAYWLERTGVDLDAWMRRRWVRLLYGVLRLARRAWRRLAN